MEIILLLILNVSKDIYLPVFILYYILRDHKKLQVI